MCSITHARSIREHMLEHNGKCQLSSVNFVHIHMAAGQWRIRDFIGGGGQGARVSPPLPRISLQLYVLTTDTQTFREGGSLSPLAPPCTRHCCWPWVI